MKFQARTNEKRQLDVRWDLVNTYLSRWKPDTLFDIEIKRHQSKISDPMRKLYFAAILPEFASHLGYDPDEYLLFHRQLKIIYFNVEPDKRGIYRKVPHVFANESNLVVSEKKKFIEWVLRKAAQEGKVINV
jgi:hypothetical protein